jgi:uncharacterized membrane protein HdeD (DUF308 family)
MLASRLEFGLASRWGWVVFRGVVAVLFGLLALARPGITWLSLILLFGVYAFVEGVANVISAARGGRAGEPRWGMLLVEGLLSIAVAALALMWPATTALAFVWVIGAWAIVTGVLEIVAAIRLRKMIEHEWAMGLAGALSIAFGFLALFRPMAGALALVWWLGAYAIVFGILLVVVGFHLRRVLHRGEERGGHLPGEGLHQPG